MMQMTEDVETIVFPDFRNESRPMMLELADGSGFPVVYREATESEVGNPQYLDEDAARFQLSADGQAVLMPDPVIEMPIQYREVTPDEARYPKKMRDIEGDWHTVSRDQCCVVRHPDEAPALKSLEEQKPWLIRHWKATTAVVGGLALATLINYQVRFGAADKTTAVFNQRADLVTVFTGGRGKIQRGFEICGKDQYLLISGCNPVAGMNRILSVNGYNADEHTPKESIRFGYSAIDTTGNVEELCDFLDLPGNSWIDEVVVVTYSSHTARSNQALQKELENRPDLASRVTFKWDCVGGNSPWQGDIGGLVEAAKTGFETVLGDFGQHMRSGELDIRTP